MFGNCSTTWERLQGWMEPALGEVSRCWQAAKGNDHVQDAEQIQGLEQRGPGIIQDEVWSQGSSARCRTSPGVPHPWNCPSPHTAAARAPIVAFWDFSSLFFGLRHFVKCC